MPDVFAISAISSPTLTIPSNTEPVAITPRRHHRHTPPIAPRSRSKSKPFTCQNMNLKAHRFSQSRHTVIVARLSPGYYEPQQN